jgi:glycosyltransferase involved in cell wall biosynthesis
MVKISAIICTFKRPDYLRQALRSLSNQTLARNDYEIIVVDNAVQPEAEQVVREFQNEEIHVRYVTEKEVGLSRARNKGLSEARGRYVAYLDDDARADERWLAALLESFAKSSPPAAAVGGRVWLDWQGRMPRWIPNDQLSLYSYVDHGNQAHLLREDEYLVGANLAFDRELLKEIGGFDSNLGRQGNVLLSGEEAQIVQALRRKDFPILYEPAAVVWHTVHRSRQHPSWLLKRMFWDGASQPLLDRLATEKSRRVILRSVCSDLRQCAGWSMRAMSASIRGRKTTAWQSLLGLSQRAGRVRTQILLIASIDD